jgi:Domain of unknown function (DUF4279)
MMFGAHNLVADGLITALPEIILAAVSLADGVEEIEVNPMGVAEVIIDMINDALDEPQIQPLEYHFRLLIHHPDIDPDEITKALCIEPDRCWRMGEAVKTPKGAIVGGVYNQSTWNKKFTIKDERDFFYTVAKFATLLQPRIDFLHHLTNSGGEVLLTIDLSGFANIGDTMKWQDLALFADLKINLGVEVFPDC